MQAKAGLAGQNGLSLPAARQNWASHERDGDQLALAQKHRAQFQPHVRNFCTKTLGTVERAIYINTDYA